MKPCTKCKKVKPLSEFHNHPGNGDGKQTVCKGCRNTYNAIYRKRLAAIKAGDEEPLDPIRERKILKTIARYDADIRHQLYYKIGDYHLDTLEPASERSGGRDPIPCEVWLGGELLGTYPNCATVAREYGITPSCVCKALNRAGTLETGHEIRRVSK